MIECLGCGKKLTTTEQISAHSCGQRHTERLPCEPSPGIAVTACTICGKNTVVRGFCQNPLCPSSTFGVA